MFPISKEQIEKLDASDLDSLFSLDSNGFFLAPEESLQEYKKRILLTAEKIAHIDKELRENGEYALFDEMHFRSEDCIPSEIMSEAAEITRRLYGFAVDWAPGFFLSQGVGFLWGGCAISLPEERIMLFLLRNSFAKKKRWFIYRRDELLSHELCHIARMPLCDRTFEEHFAYQTSNSRFRRYIGNCFRSKWDSIFFLAPVMILLAVQIAILLLELPVPIWPFWILAGAYPAYLIARNHMTRIQYFRARKVLLEFGAAHPDFVLFRCSKEEIVEISRIRDNNKAKEWLKNKAASELRWRIIMRYFADGSSGE